MEKKMTNITIQDTDMRGQDLTNVDLLLNMLAATEEVRQNSAGPLINKTEESSSSLMTNLPVKPENTKEIGRDTTSSGVDKTPKTKTKPSGSQRRRMRKLRTIAAKRSENLSTAGPEQVIEKARTQPVDNISPSIPIALAVGNQSISAPVDTISYLGPTALAVGNQNISAPVDTISSLGPTALVVRNCSTTEPEPVTEKAGTQLVVANRSMGPTALAVMNQSISGLVPITEKAGTRPVDTVSTSGPTALAVRDLSAAGPGPVTEKAGIQPVDTIRPSEPTALVVMNQSCVGPGPVTEKYISSSPETSMPNGKRAKIEDSSKTSFALTASSRVAIIPCGYPFTQLSREESEEVKFQLISFVDQLEEGGVQPEFSGFSYHQGGCIVVCDNLCTKDWVSSVMNNFTISGGITLRTGNMNELKQTITVGGFFPGEKVTDELLLRRLRIQNGKVPDVNKWALIGRKDEKNGFFGVLRMPVTSIKYLEGKNLLVTYGVSKVSLRIFDKKKPKPTVPKTRDIKEEKDIEPSTSRGMDTKIEPAAGALPCAGGWRFISPGAFGDASRPFKGDNSPRAGFRK